MVKRLFLACCIFTALGASSFAGASHDDPTSDPAKCDTWWRRGHGHTRPTDPQPNYYPSHDHTHSSDTALGDPAHTTIHAQSGHYVVRNDFGYVEVVGGGSYRGPDPQGNNFPGQGGYVQGELDAGSGVDGDFNAAYFGPNADAPPAADPAAIQAWVEGQYGHVCVDAGGQHHEQETREP